MHRWSEYNPLWKVHYRPIEAAIRWSGLARHETEIIETLDIKQIPAPDDFPRWPALRLNTERIYDAIRNRELPYGIDGITIQDNSSLDNPNVTIRHVDLKSWMSRFYPDQRPEFLYSEVERIAPPVITVDMVQALALERDALKLQIEQRDREIQNLRKSRSVAQRKVEGPTPDTHDGSLSLRSETTYLHIVGALLDLLLGRTPSGQPYSSFTTQEAIISAITAHHGERLGISKSTLEAKFAAARRTLAHH